MSETVLQRRAEELQKDDQFEVGGAMCKVLTVIPRIGQPGAVLIRFRLVSDLTRDFYSMWINAKYTFNIHVPTTPKE